MQSRTIRWFTIQAEPITLPNFFETCTFGRRALFFQTTAMLILFQMRLFILLCLLPFIALVNAHTEEASETTLSLSKCVTLDVYGDHQCSGHPLRALTFSSFDEPGSACYHDSTMVGYSVKNQYCTATSFEQEVFSGSSCDSWWNYIMGPQKQVFTADACLYGLKFVSCEPGPCGSTE